MSQVPHFREANELGGAKMILALTACPRNKPATVERLAEIATPRNVTERPASPQGSSGKGKGLEG